MVKPGSFNGKDLLLAWIQHLCLIEQRPRRHPAVRDAKQSLRAAKACGGRGAAQVGGPGGLWTQGMKRPLPFFPEHRLGVAQGSRRIRQSRRRPTRRRLPASTAATW